MRFIVRFDPKANRYAVIDSALANHAVGLHATFDDAFSHAEAEENLWRRYGQARQSADLYRRQLEARWVA